MRDLTLESLRAASASSLQEPLLFSGSIVDNIRYGRLDATDEEIEEAAKAANAHDFITACPRATTPTLGERGAKISGGERQRHRGGAGVPPDAPILILDEPTSSIDSKTEAVILDALDRLMEGRTTIMIAHRLSTLAARRSDPRAGPRRRSSRRGPTTSWSRRGGCTGSCTRRRVGLRQLAACTQDDIGPAHGDRRRRSCDPNATPTPWPDPRPAGTESAARGGAQ